MLRIGEFSGLTGISINMLRNYDRLGLLKPEYVDKMTGYRFYSEKQLVSGNYIQVLKSLGFSLSEITEIIKADKLDERIRTFLRNKIKEKQQVQQKAEEQIVRMSRTLIELDQQLEYTLAVNIKMMPSRKVVSLRDNIRDFSEEGRLWSRLNSACQQYTVKLADVPYSLAITHSVDFERKRFDTEVFRVVDQLKPDIGCLKFSVLPKSEAAVVVFTGIYNRIGDINRYVYHWIIENGYRLNGKAINIYYRSPKNESDPKDFVTEVCYPIRK